MKKILEIPINFILFITNIEVCDKKFVDFLIQKIHEELSSGKKAEARWIFESIFEEVSWINFHTRRKLKKVKIELMELQ